MALTNERIDEIHPMVKDFLHWKRAFARAIEAEVRAESQEPIGYAHPTTIFDHLQRRREGFCGVADYAPVWFKATGECTVPVYATPQPPAPCPKYLELDRWLEAGVYFTTAEYEVEVENLNALQAKVAEQSAEIARLKAYIKWLEDRRNESGYLVAEQAERIAELEALSVRHILIDVVPGADGMGEEIYAKSVDDVDQLLSGISERNEELTSKVAEQAALIERCRDALSMPCDRWNKRQVLIVNEVLEAIEAHGGK